MFRRRRIGAKGFLGLNLFWDFPVFPQKGVFGQLFKLLRVVVVYQFV